MCVTFLHFCSILPISSPRPRTSDLSLYRTALLVYSRVAWQSVEVDFHLRTLQKQIPVQNTHEKSTADQIPNPRWDHRLPDIVACGEGFWRPKEDGKRDEIHVCDYMVGAEANKAHNGKPDRNDFRNDVAGGDSEEDCHANEPVT